MTPLSTRAEIEEIKRKLEKVESDQRSSETKINHLYDVVLIGSSDQPSHREVIKLMAKFLVDNEKLPETVRTQGRWIENINRLGWAAVLILLGILINNIFNK
jgi:cell division protein FtsX